MTKINKQTAKLKNSIIVLTLLYLLQITISLLFDFRENYHFDRIQFAVVWLYIICLPILYLVIKIAVRFSFSGWSTEICFIGWIMFFIYSTIFIV